MKRLLSSGTERKMLGSVLSIAYPAIIPTKRKAIASAEREGASASSKRMKSAATL